MHKGWWYRKVLFGFKKLFKIKPAPLLCGSGKVIYGITWTFYSRFARSSTTCSLYSHQGLVNINFHPLSVPPRKGSLQAELLNQVLIVDSSITVLNLLPSTGGSCYLGWVIYNSLTCARLRQFYVWRKTEKKDFRYWFYGSHGGEHEDGCLLGCCAM
jgi:hypothetical protein